MMFESALESLRRGEFVLLHDSESRENEVDMVVYAGLAGPEHVARMRLNAGGLICVALGYEFASSLRLQYMHDILAESPAMQEKEMIMGLAPYGDRSTFSISVNSRRTFTGITDRDRATTISEIAAICGSGDEAAEFVRSFRTPGHVPLLIAAEGLLKKRRGHTEMSIYLAQTAGLHPAVAVCEMLDADTYAALSLEKATDFAARHGIPLIDGQDLVEKYAGVH